MSGLRLQLLVLKTIIIPGLLRRFFNVNHPRLKLALDFLCLRIDDEHVLGGDFKLVRPDQAGLRGEVARDPRTVTVSLALLLSRS